MTDKILPIIALFLGWALSEFGKFSTQRKNNIKKFKRLLFNLLELRWLLKREYDLNEEITTCVERLKLKLTQTFGAEATEGADIIQPLITEILKDKLVDLNRIKEIESNLDFTISELAEIHPVFAYELSGRYKIKERLDNAEQYFNEVSQYIEDMPKELTDWIQPKLTFELIVELEDNIIEIAKKISRRTKNDVSGKLEVNNNNETEEMDEFIDEYIERVKTMYNN